MSLAHRTVGAGPGSPTTLVVPDRDAGLPSGGDRYDARVAASWPGQLRVHRAPGAWPWPSPADTGSLARTLQHLGDGPVLLDGLVGSAVPDLVAASAVDRPTAVLVHSTLSAGSAAHGERAAELDERERRALRSAHLVVTTSSWSAADLGRRYGLAGVVVARPGSDAAPVSPGTAASGAPPRLLALAALTPLKNHITLLEALSRLHDHDWTLVAAGPAPAPGFAAELADAARQLGLTDRVRWPGALTGRALEEVWAGTDLLVHPARTETWGLVVTEALARGVPAVVGRGTGAEEALHAGRGDAARPTGGEPGAEEPGTEAPGTDEPGAAVDVGGRDQLVQVLGLWLADPSTRGAWRRAALRSRDRLPGWEQTARSLHEALAALRQ